jgi:hypothetical protein
MNTVGRTLILIGLFLVVFGSLLLFAERLFPFFGRLPGDIALTRKNLTLFIPFTTMLVLSVAVTLVMNILSRWMK